MKHRVAVLLLLAAIRPADGFSPAPRHSSPRLGGPSSLVPLSSAAALSADENSKVNYDYGPAIELGNLKVNLFGAIFGLWEVLCGVCFWYPATALYGLSRTISAKLPGDLLRRIDPLRRVPICLSYIWVVLSYMPFGMFARVEGRENLEALREVDEDGRKGKLKPAMFVANHSSWMDIPFVARVFRFVNFKFIAKAELRKVPIVGAAVMVGGHVTLDRTSRRSQMDAYKSGVGWLRDGVNLVTFPEGTRSRDGRMGSFKKGAFKMAQATGAPVVPMSIHHAGKVQPREYAFPARSSRWSRPRAVIRIGRPIATEGRTDDELLEEVWGAIADSLPEDQRPAGDTPMGVK